MSSALPVIHRLTELRAQRLRLIVATLMQRELPRDEIGDLIEVSPSGVRKYVKDLGAKIEVARYIDGTDTFIGYPVYRLAITADEARAYLASLSAAPAVRSGAGGKSAFSLACKDPARRFHILADDTHYAIRLNRSPVARDPLVAAFFGSRTVEMRA